MNNCIETMMEEHELIVHVLASLHALSQGLAAGTPVERRDVADFGRFFRDFADQCHHGKEEDRLFAKMVEAGFPRESGPVGVMLFEHDAGRREVRGLLEIGAGSGPLKPAEITRILACAEQFIPLLYGHIQKENRILYPMAQQAIPAEEFDRLNQSCAAFDRDLHGRLDVSELRRLAADLGRRYPAAAGALDVFSTCGGCASGAH